MDSKRTIGITTLHGKIAMMFFLLAMAMEGLMIFFWIVILEPKLKIQEEAGVRAMAQAQAQPLADALSPAGSEIKKEVVLKIMDRILLLINPNTGTPFISAVSLVLEYDVLNLPHGSLDITVGDADCKTCFVTEIPLYSPVSREFIGVARFHCTSDFFENFKINVRNRLLAVSGCALLLMLLAWWGADILLKPLRLLASSLLNLGVNPVLPLPELTGHMSDEILMVKNALDEMLARINDRMEEREKLIDELRHLQNLLSNIIDSMPSMLAGVDGEIKVTQWNMESERVTGVKRSMALGRIITETFPQLEDDVDMIRHAILYRAPRRREKVTKFVNGKELFTDITVYPLITNGIEGAVIRIDDITERVRLEEMMVQSEKMLSIGGMAAGMAHEINNPLAGIIQNIQVIKNRLAESIPSNVTAAQESGTTLESIEMYMHHRGIFDIIESIMESCRRASKIVKNMLEFSRKSDSLFIQHDIRELLDKAIELASNDYNLKKKFDFRSIEIVRNYDPSTPEIFCEANKIEQVFLNVLSNGAQAMSEGGGKGSPCFTLNVMPENDIVKIEIADNGPGMIEEIRKKVFEPFFTTKGVGVGTGLGLSVSYFIVTQNHGGTMSVTSSPGNGSTFIIRLPIQKNKK